MDCKAALISAQTPKIAGNYNTVELSVDEYHTSEVFTLALIYQLIHSGGFDVLQFPQLLHLQRYLIILCDEFKVKT